MLWRLRLRAAGVSLAAVAFGAAYFFVRQAIKDSIWRFDLYLFNKALAVASLFLVSLSLLLTSIRFFSRRPRRGLAHRKHFGLAGFWTGAVHGLVSHVFLAGKFPLPAWMARNPLAAGLGLAALALFGWMAVLSLAKIKGKMGGERWRKTLRTAGYAALVLAALHAASLKWGSWTKYLSTFESVLPSLSLPAVLFAAAVVLLRLFVRAAKKH
ncbi:MAG: hypothetical protein FJY83_00405 [Candidatus Aminicenantes bacterium]|nr:hypothetical protein [Candidatus Aminicenantes bacterium]